MKKAKAETQRKTVWDELYKDRMPISVSLSLIVLALGGWYLVYPRWKALQATRALTATQEQKNSDLQGVVSRLETFEQNYLVAKEQSQKTSIGYVVADSLDVASILSDVVAVGEQARVPLAGVSVEEETKEQIAKKKKEGVAIDLPKGVASAMVVIKLQGVFDYPAYKAFIRSLERVLPLYDLEESAVKASAQTSESATKSIQLTARTYYRVSESAKKPNAAAATTVSPEL